MSENRIRPYGPGKFDTILDAYVYGLSLNGCDEETGDSGTTGWYGLLRGLQTDGAFSDVAASAELNEAEIEYLREHSAGCIVCEDSQGFVSVLYFAGEEALERTWNRCIEVTAESDE